MKIPDWYELVLLGLAAWRSFQLVAFDEVLNRPRRWALRLGDEWKDVHDPIPDDYRYAWARWLVCPYCAGAWVALAWWASFEIWAKETLVLASLLAVSTLVIGLAKILSSEKT